MKGFLALLIVFSGCASGDEVGLVGEGRDPAMVRPHPPAPGDPNPARPDVGARDDVTAVPTEEEGPDLPEDGELPTSVCADALGDGPFVEGPQGLMIQVPSVRDTCELERALDHVCRAHPEMQDLVLTSVDTWTSGRVTAELKLDVLEAIAPYLHCFGNVFVGTVSEILLPDPYGAWTIEDEGSRWTWIRAARELAPQIAEWMDAHVDRWHWYLSYEANLNAFTDTGYRNAYIALLEQHIADLREIRDATVAWSPTFWTPPASLSAAQRDDLSSALEETFERVPVDWVLVQDHLGVQPSWTCGDALTYHEMVSAAAPHLASVQLNVEYFTTGGPIRQGDPDELAARVDCYRDAGASMGASFELRYWYRTHGH